MNVFELRERLISDYSSYIRSFVRIRDQRIDGLVAACLGAGVLWPDPLIQLNASFRFAGTIDDMVADGIQTPLTSAYAIEILNQTRASSLEEAIRKARKPICTTD